MVGVIHVPSYILYPPTDKSVNFHFKYFKILFDTNKGTDPLFDII